MKRASRALCTASVWASFLLSSGPACADDVPPHPGQAVKAEANASAQPSDAGDEGSPKPSPEQAAAIAYQKALASYSQGDVAAALNSMRQSYQLSKRAELLYNLAQLEEELKACSDSLADYRRYLELVPQGRYREAAERACARLEPQCPPPAAAPVPAATVATNTEPAAHDDQPKPPAGKPESNSYWTTTRLIGWSAIATGALASAGGLYFTLEAKQAKAAFQQSVDSAYAGGPAPDMSLQDRQHRDQTLATAFWITGGALVAGGVLALLLEPGKHEQHSRSARLYATPSLVGACYTQSF